MKELAALFLHPIRTLNDWLSWPDLDGEDTQEQQHDQTH